VGVYRLAKKNALVRRAVSVENIGRITYICTDKTGTITCGKITLTHLDPFDLRSEIDLLKAGLYASNSQGNDPVDNAIQEVAKKKKVSAINSIQRFPFTEDRKRESAFVIEEDLYISYMKGSPEMIINLSDLSDENKLIWKKRITTWTQKGH